MTITPYQSLNTQQTNDAERRNAGRVNNIGRRQVKMIKCVVFDELGSEKRKITTLQVGRCEHVDIDTEKYFSRGIDETAGKRDRSELDAHVRIQLILLVRERE